MQFNNIFYYLHNIISLHNIQQLEPEKYLISQSNIKNFVTNKKAMASFFLNTTSNDFQFPQIVPPGRSDEHLVQEDYYEFEKIIGKKKNRSKILYLVKWKGYSTEESTWQPAKNLKYAQNQIKLYEQMLLKDKDNTKKNLNFSEKSLENKLVEKQTIQKQHQHQNNQISKYLIADKSKGLDSQKPSKVCNKRQEFLDFEKKINQSRSNNNSENIKKKTRSSKNDLINNDEYQIKKLKLYLKKSKCKVVSKKRDRQNNLSKSKINITSSQTSSQLQSQPIKKIKLNQDKISIKLDKFQSPWKNKKDKIQNETEYKQKKLEQKIMAQTIQQKREMQIEKEEILLLDIIQKPWKNSKTEKNNQICEKQLDQQKSTKLLKPNQRKNIQNQTIKAKQHPLHCQTTQQKDQSSKIKRIMAIVQTGKQKSRQYIVQYENKQIQIMTSQQILAVHQKEFVSYLENRIDKSTQKL